MSTLLDYTTYESIRAVLGIVAKELPDTVLSTNFYLFKLEALLIGLDSDLLDQFVTASGESTPEAIKFISSVQLYSACTVAQTCAGVLANIAPKSLTDGKGAFGRHSDKAYLDMVTRIGGEASFAKMNLLQAYDDYAGTSTYPAYTAAAPVFLGISLPDYDPVTGE